MPRVDKRVVFAEGFLTASFVPAFKFAFGLSKVHERLRSVASEGRAKRRINPRRRKPPSPTVEPSKSRLLAILGPGLITGASDDDPSGIATYSQAGAQFDRQVESFGLQRLPSQSDRPFSRFAKGVRG